MVDTRKLIIISEIDEALHKNFQAPIDWHFHRFVDASS